MANNSVFVAATGIVDLLPDDFDASTVATAVEVIAETTNLGLVGEDGITMTPERDVENIKVMNYGATVKRVVTESSVTIEVPLAELLDANDRLVFGSERVGEKIEWIPGRVLETPLLVDIVSNTWGGIAGQGRTVERYIFPICTVEEVGEIAYVFGEATVRTITFRADVDPNSGVAAYHFRTIVAPEGEGGGDPEGE